ncbi:DUF3883 domain-containing protein [Streptomyces sp. NPDC047002]|uniref:protein NO VEIN domain-containing protein n=1 Tax=Streptomyces sp. NPDC047002 TaxID=3155475 RepID=UPI003456273F
MRTASFVMVHVGQSMESQRNLCHGINTRTWGFPEWSAEFSSAHAQFAILAIGAAPRVPLDVWVHKMITVCLFAVREGFYRGSALHWPDEQTDGTIKYPVRFGMDPLAVLHDVPLSEEGPLGLAGSDAVRRSGQDRGIGKLLDLDPQPLLDAAGIPVDWEKQQAVPLKLTPGFTPDQVVAPTAKEHRPRGTGFVSDPKIRKAVELHAEDLAVAHYKGQGWTVTRMGRPYDLHCTRKSEERHVEVKGTTGAAASVDLTINEVQHARDPRHTVDLYVVSDIKVDVRNKSYATHGGRVLHLLDWSPADGDLRPRNLDYSLPRTR